MRLYTFLLLALGLVSCSAADSKKAEVQTPTVAKKTFPEADLFNQDSAYAFVKKQSDNSDNLLFSSYIWL